MLTRDYATQSGDTAALEPDNANGWYDAAWKELHLVVPSQSPQEVAEAAAAMLAKSRIGAKRLFLHPCFTVGYGSKDHAPMPYYGLVAALYGDGRPVRLANDRFDQFQAGLKRHQFSMRYKIGVDRRTGLLQSFQAGILANGGGPGELLRRPHHGGRDLGGRRSTISQRPTWRRPLSPRAPSIAAPRGAMARWKPWRRPRS